VANFLEALFSKIGESSEKPPRHPKWREVDLALTLAGWTWFEPAEIWLNLNGAGGARAAATDFRAQFCSYLSARHRRHAELGQDAGAARATLPGNGTALERAIEVLKSLAPPTRSPSGAGAEIFVLRYP
jgi:hypothetical protein